MSPATPPREPVRHWFAVRDLLARGPLTYRDVSRELRFNPWHANTLMRRLANHDLIEVARRGIPGKRPTLYRLPKTNEVSQ